MKLGDSIIRVSEEQTNAKLAAGYKYCPRSEWKKIRDAGKKAAKDAEAKAKSENKAEKNAETSLKGKARKNRGHDDDRELVIRNA